MTTDVLINAQPPYIGTKETKSSNNYTNVFVKDADGDTVSLTELLENVVAGEVKKASPVELLRLILIEMRAQSHMLATIFALENRVESYRGIDPLDDSRDG